jgi:hypothetical protein
LAKKSLASAVRAVSSALGCAENIIKGMCFVSS